MDTDLILETIFEEYKKKCIKEGKKEQVVKEHLEDVKTQMDEAVRDITDDFIGQPNNERTRGDMVDAIRDQLNSFLDTEVSINRINHEDDRIDVDMTIRPKSEDIPMEVETNLTTLVKDPMSGIVSTIL